MRSQKAGIRCTHCTIQWWPKTRPSNLYLKNTTSLAKKNCLQNLICVTFLTSICMTHQTGDNLDLIYIPIRGVAICHCRKTKKLKRYFHIVVCNTHFTLTFVPLVLLRVSSDVLFEVEKCFLQQNFVRRIPQAILAHILDALCCHVHVFSIVHEDSVA